VVYEAGSGQLLAGSFTDYAMPRADGLPSFRLAFQETLNPNNALGVKGCSETGVAGAPAAIANAVLDALGPLGVRDLELPLTAERVWRAIRDARCESGGARSARADERPPGPL
jgi:carbon-monoxide dehydrogenase large subunit